MLPLIHPSPICTDSGITEAHVVKTGCGVILSPVLVRATVSLVGLPLIPLRQNQFDSGTLVSSYLNSNY